MNLLQMAIEGLGYTIIIWAQLLAFSILTDNDKGIDGSLWVLVGLLAIQTVLVSLRGVL